MTSPSPTPNKVRYLIAGTGGVGGAIGAFLALLMFRQWPERTFWIALPLMLLGTYFASVKRTDAA